MVASTQPFTPKDGPRAAVTARYTPLKVIRQGSFRTTGYRLRRPSRYLLPDAKGGLPTVGEEPSARVTRLGSCY